jgi:prepilin-type N-terminal cleavage/methylation domain-containing protein
VKRVSQGPNGRRCIRSSYRGFSLLELVIVIVIISVLLVMAISRLLALQVDAERVTMEMVAGTLRSAIGMKVAQSIVELKVAELSALEGSNPMAQLAETPQNYLGERDGVDPAALEDGNWYFDRQAKVLVYLVRNKGFFTGGQPNPPRARFALRLVYSDKNGNGVFNPGVDAIEGLRLSPVETYSWSRY